MARLSSGEKKLLFLFSFPVDRIPPGGENGGELYKKIYLYQISNEKREIDGEG